MNADLLMAEIVAIESISDLFDNIALSRLPENASYPAMVYHVISDVRQHATVSPAEISLFRARIQIDIIAESPETTTELHQELRKILDNSLAATTAKFKIYSMYLDSAVDFSYDDKSALWKKSVDYRVLYSF